jgi:hypothetical protein
MKQFGYAILALGVIALLGTLSMDTSVPSGMFERVNNMGLMQDKQNFLIVSALIFLVGVVMVAIGFKTPPPENGYSKGKKFALVLSWVVVALAGGRFIYTLTPQYQEQKAEMEKNNAELQETLEKLERSVRELQRLRNQ